MINVSEAIALVQTQAEYNGHNPDMMERGLAPFVTLRQVGFIAGLLRKCNCPEEWRLWLTGQLVGRELRSSKDLSMAEASAILDYLLVGSDGKGDSEREPCAEAVEVVGKMLMQAMAHGVAKMKRGGGGQRVEVVQQLGFC